MGELSDKNFGLLIAYLLPGLVVLSVASRHSEMIRSWLGPTPADAPTIGGFLYGTLASIAAGMTVSALRWLILDFIHHRTGIARPAWDFTRLQANLAAFEGAVENHYKYYQFYGNMLMALAIAAADQRSLFFPPRLEAGVMAILLLAVGALFFAASRDALKKYYDRTAHLLGTTPERKGQLS